MTWRVALTLFVVGIVILVAGANMAGAANPPTKVLLPLVYGPPPPTPTATVTPIPFVYSDDFSNAGSGWPIVSNSSWSLAYVSNEYQILVHLASTWTGARNSSHTTSPNVLQFGASSDVRLANGYQGAYGIIFDIANDWSSLYAFIVDPVFQQNSLWKNVNGTWTALSAWQFSGAINQGQASNHITVIRTGSTIECFVNGSQLITVTNSDLSTGDTGLFAETESATTEVDARFDNFLLRSPGLVGQ